MKQFDWWIPLVVLFLGVSALAFVQRETLFSSKTYGQPRFPQNAALHTPTNTNLPTTESVPNAGYLLTAYGDSVWADYTWDDLVRRIKKREGFMPLPYVCAAGSLTIGYGHTIKPEDKEWIQHIPEAGISEARATQLLYKDLAYSRWFVEKFLGEHLSDLQIIALTNFCYAFGTTKLHNSQLFAQITQGKDVSDAFAQWVHINGEPNSYLAKERAFEQALYLLGKASDGTFALAR